MYTLLFCCLPSTYHFISGGPMKVLETDHVISGSMRGLERNRIGNGHQTHIQTDIVTLWLTQPWGPSQWKFWAGLSFIYKDGKNFFTHSHNKLWNLWAKLNKKDGKSCFFKVGFMRYTLLSMLYTICGWCENYVNTQHGSV